MTRKDMATKQLEKHMLLTLIRPRDKRENKMNDPQIVIAINLIELLALLYVFVSVRMLQKNKRFYLKSWKKAEEENMELKEKIESLENTITQLAVKEVDYSDFDETK